jgi:branched-chain amino acid transport system substrate-binding protein
MPRWLLAFPAALTMLAAADARADVTVGVAGPMTGNFAVLGQQLRAGAAQAVADINRAGGVNGEMLRLEVVDDACDAKTADAVANQLVGRGAQLVVGHVCLSASLAAATVYAMNKVVEISPATTYAKFTDERAGPGIFRLAERDDQQGAAAGQFLAARFANRNVAIVSDETQYGRSLADAVRRAMNAAGKREVLTQQYSANTADFAELIGRLKAAAIDAAFVAGSEIDVGRFVKQLRDAGVMTLVIGGESLASDAFRQAAGAAAQGTLMTLPFDARKNPDAAAVAKAFRDAGTEPAGYVLPAYAAVRIWAAAAGGARTFAFDRVVATLASQAFPSVLGSVRFNAKGDANIPGYVLYEWRDGRYDTLQR